MESQWSVEHERHHYSMIDSVMSVHAQRLLRLLVLVSDSVEHENELLSVSRVTFYYCHDDRLYTVARFSRNLELGKRGRSSYPPNEGCIGLAYTGGRIAFERFPSKEEEWIQYNMTQYKISERECRGMKMKSRVILAVRMEHDEHPMGAIAIESLNSDFIDESLVDSVNDKTAVRWAVETASAVMFSMKDDIELWLNKLNETEGARRESGRPGGSACRL